MSFSWSATIVQIVFIGLILLFFFSFYRFIKGIVYRSKITNETLTRLEKKIDTLIDRQQNDHD
jgi:hypothetical protein